MGEKPGSFVPNLKSQIFVLIVKFCFNCKMSATNVFDAQLVWDKN